MKTKTLAKALMAMVLVPTVVYAYDWSVGGAAVTILEPSYMPGHIAFQIDKGSAACPSGTWLVYFGQGSTTETQQQNARVTYATLMSAMLSGKKVSIYGANNCYTDHVHLLP